MGWVREFEVMCGAVTQFLARSRYSVFTAIIILIVIEELVSITSSSGMFLWWPAWGFLSLCSSRRSGSLNRVVGCLLLPCPILSDGCSDLCLGNEKGIAKAGLSRPGLDPLGIYAPGGDRANKSLQEKAQPHWLTVVSRKILTRV